MGKRLHTAQMLIEKWAYLDKDLVKDTIAGFPLTGMMPFTGIFDYAPKLPTATETTLRSQSDTHNRSMISRCNSSGSLDLDSQFLVLKLQRSGSWLAGRTFLRNIQTFSVSSGSEAISHEEVSLPPRYDL